MEFEVASELIGLRGREDVNNALREDKVQDCASSLHHGVSEDLSQ